MKLLLVISPEFFLSFMICVIMLSGLWSSKKYKNFIFHLSQITLFILFILTLHTFHLGKIFIFHKQYVSDNLSNFLKLYMYICISIIFLYSKSYIKNKNIIHNEFYLLTLFSLLGSMILVSANSMIILYLGIELMVFPLYGMIAMNKNINSVQSAIKYFIMGIIASSILLYGISILYGISGYFQFSQIFHFNNINLNILNFGLIFLLTGIFFKFGLVPFHMWIPNIYRDSPIVVLAIIGTISKIAIFGLISRLLFFSFFHIKWINLFFIISLLSLIVGNLLAILQKNLKVMLGYSSIAQLGFMFLGIIIGNKKGEILSLFYIVSYTFSSLGIWSILAILSQFTKEDIKYITDLNGLNANHGIISYILILLLFSMIGIPPLIGFTSKVFIINELIKIHWYYFSISILLISIITAYYYIKVIKAIYIPNINITYHKKFRISKISLIGIGVIGLGTFIIGIFPNILLSCFQYII